MSDSNLRGLTLIEHCDVARRLLDIERGVVMLARGMRETSVLPSVRADLEDVRSRVDAVRHACSEALVAGHPNVGGGWRKLYFMKSASDIDALAAGLSGASGIESLLVEAGESPRTDEVVELTRLDGYTRGYVRSQFWSCPSQGIVRVEMDTTPGIEETRVIVESSVCSRCCRVEGDCGIDDEPRLVRVAPCWREGSLISSAPGPSLFGE